MRLARTLTVVAVVAGSAATAHGQRPDFSGTWLLVAPAEAAGQAAGQEETITQTDTTITFGHPSTGGGHQMAYRLDGQPTENVVAGRRLASRASWDGRKLVLVDRDATGAPLHPGVTETTKIIYIDETGSLVMELKPPIADRPAKLVWRKR